MRGKYDEDTFSESDVLRCLEGAGLRYKVGSRYILSQCPLHADSNASAQIYRDDWFVKCHAGCEGGRFHITKAFPELRDGQAHVPRRQADRPHKAATEVKYADKSAEIQTAWAALPPIPADHYFKNIDIERLNQMGWRWDSAHNRYLIPYYSRSRKSIPFAQWRNLSPGANRFNFWKDAKPTMYGTWNLTPGDPVFLVEGCSDAMVMDYCGVPWIAAPSAASGELVKALAKWCQENDVAIIYAGDNDDAGDKLKDALGEVMSFRARQPRKPYKDWSDMFEAEGWESVQNYCFAELFPGELPTQTPDVSHEKTPLEAVQDVFPGAQQMTLVGKGSKEATQNSPVQP